MRRWSVIWLLTVMVSLSAWAQQSTTVSGKVVSGTTGKVVSGASVSGGGQTVVTNDDGYFLLKSQSALTEIVVSHVGYRSERIREKSGRWKEGGLRIRLQPTSIQLQEVFVLAGADPRELVESAISKIPQNYGREPELFHSF